MRKYEVALIDRTYDGYCFLLGFTVHPRDEKEDFLEINIYFIFLVLHIKIF